MVVVARFRDTRRAVRMKHWLRRSHIWARLSDGEDGRVELAVPRHHESRALDLLVTLFAGLDIDHIKPEPAWERAMSLENTVTGAAIALVVFVTLLIAWLAFPVLAVVPFGIIAVLTLGTFAIVAIMPGRPGSARDYNSGFKPRL